MWCDLKIGLIDVDGHNFPNLALMRISSYHKERGNDVEWWREDGSYDTVYMSRIFSDGYTKPAPEPENAEKVIRGGSGYCISVGKDGREHYDKSKENNLPSDMEKMFPDYSIYPQYDFAVAMTSRGCPRGCAFCHVAAKEGRCAVKVADVKDFYAGQKVIQVIDPNIVACKDKAELFRQYRDTGAKITFNQGLDIRLLTDADIEAINGMRVEKLHFAWDNPQDRLEEKFANFAKKYKRPSSPGVVYVLVGFNSTIEEDLYRIQTLWDMAYKPYVTVYDRLHASRRVKDLQQWCNFRKISLMVPNFYDYDGYTFQHERYLKKKQKKLEQKLQEGNNNNG